MVSMHIDSAPSGRNVQALPSFGRVPERSEGGWVDLQVHVDFAAQKIISEPMKIWSQFRWLPVEQPLSPLRGQLPNLGEPETFRCLRIETN